MSSTPTTHISLTTGKRGQDECHHAAYPPGGRCPGRDHRGRRSRSLRQRRRQAGSRREAAKLVVDTFGEFGYDELVKQYEKDTGIKVELRKTAQLGDYRPKLVRYLATGKGAADVVALEEGILNEFKPNPPTGPTSTPLVARPLARTTCPGSGSWARRRTAG